MLKTITLIGIACVLAACQNHRVPENSKTFEEITAPIWIDVPYPRDRVTQRQWFELDIDHDGMPETFVEQPLTRGNAGCDHRIYRRHGDHYELMGTLFFNRLAFNVLRPTDEHSIRLMRYWHRSGSEGSVDTIVYLDGEFISVKSEIIYPGDGGTDEGRRRYAELFGAQSSR